MLHEMTDFLNNEETKFYADFLISLLGKVDQSHIDVNDPFFTKFYKFPLIRLVSYDFKYVNTLLIKYVYFRCL